MPKDDLRLRNLQFGSRKEQKALSFADFPFFKMKVNCFWVSWVADFCQVEFISDSVGDTGEAMPCICGGVVRVVKCACVAMMHAIPGNQNYTILQSIFIRISTMDEVRFSKLE